MEGHFELQHGSLVVFRVEKGGCVFLKHDFKLNSKSVFFQGVHNLYVFGLFLLKERCFFGGGPLWRLFFPVLVHKVFFGVTGEPRGAPKIGGLG